MATYDLNQLKPTVVSRGNLLGQIRLHEEFSNLLQRQRSGLLTAREMKMKQYNEEMDHTGSDIKQANEAPGCPGRCY